jgi:hypothetical protein
MYNIISHSKLEKLRQDFPINQFVVNFGINFTETETYIYKRTYEVSK